MLLRVGGRLADVLDDLEGRPLLLRQDQLVVMVVVVDALAREVELHVEDLPHLDRRGLLAWTFQLLRLHCLIPGVVHVHPAAEIGF
jgi:hypothetical protein